MKTFLLWSLPAFVLGVMLGYYFVPPKFITIQPVEGATPTSVTQQHQPDSYAITPEEAAYLWSLKHHNTLVIPRMDESSR